MNDAQELFREGVRAIREQGDMERGRKLLTQSVRIDPNNDKAWVWLAQAVDNPEHKLKCLNKALQLNPSNVQAQALKKRLGREESLDSALAAAEQSSQSGFESLRSAPENLMSSGTNPIGLSQSTVVHKAVSRATLNWIVLGLIGLVILAAVGVLSINYLYNFISGPFPADAATITNLNNLQGLQNYFVTVTGDEGLETGYEYYEESTGGQRKTLANYMALALGDRYLLVKTPADDLTARAEYTGTLVNMSIGEQRDVIGDMVNEYPDLEGVFLPFLLDAKENFRTSGFIGLGVGLVVLVLSLWLIIVGLQRRSNPTKHPIMRALERFGDPEMVASDIENDLALEKHQEGKLCLTQNWLLNMNSGTFQATRLSDMAWTYKSVTQHRTNGIPTGKTYAAYFWDQHGVLINIGGKEKQVDAMLEAVAQRVPWVVMGYSDELRAVWDKNRESFFAALDERKQKRG